MSVLYGYFSSFWCFHFPYRESMLKKHQEVESEYDLLLKLAESIQKKLEDRYQLYQFEQEVQEMTTWLASRQRLADSQDYGQDLEDVEVKCGALCNSARQQPWGQANRGRGAQYFQLFLLNSPAPYCLTATFIKLSVYCSCVRMNLPMLTPQGSAAERLTPSEGPVA
ncbi:hypothetical protein chiPu_0026761 [Chiloscyllium punctatum]|uniref:Uncharacterized protein n=1 Tax=Chiloscyllium punctatum TaxID=137246 RepID=A0A401TIY0_CHIPU|nr:hypothetical protein [Chiloscyllium punctatum]